MSAVDRVPETLRQRIAREVAQLRTDESLRVLLEQVKLAQDWERTERAKAEATEPEA